jgi:hypothetical protein
MLKIIAIAIAGMMGLSCMVGFYAIQSGIAVVNIRNKVEGTHFFVPIPVGLVNHGVNMLPGQMLRQVRGDIGQHHRIIHKLSTELEKLPDTHFVEVRKSDERVLISKSGRDMIIDVDTPEESIYIRVPIRSTSALIAKLADSAEKEY